MACVLALLLALQAPDDVSPRFELELRSTDSLDWRDGFGSTLLGIGDVDGDGGDDFLVGAPWGGSVSAFSGRSGAVLYRVQGELTDGLGSALCRLGDLDGDGVVDVAVGAAPRPGQDSGYVRVVSGRSGVELRVIRVGSSEEFRLVPTSIAALGDLDGDGVAELVVPACAPRFLEPAPTAPVAAVFSGETGQLVRVLTIGSKRPYAPYGHQVASAGDVDRDGMQDVLCGRIRGDGAQAVCVLSGLTGALLRTYPDPTGFAAGDEPIPLEEFDEWGAFGHALAMIDDIDGDGWDDHIVAGGDPSSGRSPVGIFSGATGKRLRSHEFPGPGPSMGDEAVRECADLNQDGQGDYLITYPAQFEEGTVNVFCGRTGDRLRRWKAPTTMAVRFGAAAADVGDVNGDGTIDVAVGMVPMHQSVAGVVFLFSGADGAELYWIDSGKR